MRKIILTSSSERRQNLLHMLGVPFEIDASDAFEDKEQALPVAELVQALAKVKAAAVIPRHPDAIVIAADTLVYFAGQVIGKPHDAADAQRILEMLNGQTHQVFTGLVVTDTASGTFFTDVVESAVTFKKLPVEMIKAYVATGEPLDKAGGYGLQSKGIIFLERIEGDFTNVIGLPIPTLCDILSKIGVAVL